MCYMGLESDSPIYQEFARCLHSKWENSITLATMAVLTVMITLLL